MNTTDSGLIVLSNPPKHEGVAKGASGRSMVRVSTSLTFKNKQSGAQWNSDYETFVLVNALGELEPGNFPEDVAYARLASLGATHFSEHLYLKPAQGMRSAASPTAINARAQAIKGSCSEPVRTGLEFCADALPDEEEVLDIETVQAMADLVQGLRDLAHSSELPT